MLVDSSVWVEFLRKPAAAIHPELMTLLKTGTAVMTEPIKMELLLGPTDEVALRRVEKLIASQGNIAISSDVDFDDAAALYRAVRRSGHTVRSKIDCLIAAIAIRHDVPLLHRDADFEVIAHVSELRQQSLL